MEQEITFGGLSNSPSGHISPDGDLAFCRGLMPRNGELVLTPQAWGDAKLPTGYDFMCRHITPQGERLIVRGKDSSGADLLYWCASDGKCEITESDLICIDDFGEVRSVAACGMLLLIATADGLEYALLTDSGYAVLDLRNPPIVEFGLQKAGALTMDKRYAVPQWMASSGNSGYGQGAWTTHPATSVRADETDTVAHSVFKDFKAAVASQIEGRGYWHSPFFVRYALRLNDGSHILPSPAVLMLPSLLPPMVKASVTSSGDDNAVLAIDATGMNYFSLRCRVSNIQSTTLGPYVTAIDVFATESVPTFDETLPPGGIVSYLTLIKNMSIYGSDDRGRSAQKQVFAGQWSVSNDDYADRFVSDADLSKSVWNIAPNASLTATLLSLKDFHLIASIPISEAQADTAFSELDVCETSAASIKGQPLLEADESDYARRIRPDVLWSDGSTTVAAGGEISLHRPWPLAASIAFCGSPLDPAYLPVTVTAYSRSLSGEGNASEASASALSPRYSLTQTFPHFIYSHDPGTYKIEVRQGENGWTLPMRRHPTLLGSYWMGDLEHSSMPSAGSLPQLFTPSTEPVKAKNQLYSATTSRPLAFRLRAEVGEGAIRWIAPAFRSMSSGQFGQFPLYVFTSCGIWALSASATGLPVRISGHQANSVAIAGAVVAYATDDGVFTLSGNQTDCISSAIQGAGDMWLLGCEETRGLLQAEGINAEMTTFGEALAAGRLEYSASDDTLFLSLGGDAYAYSMTDKKWGMASDAGKVAIVSRPFKLNSPSARKRLTAVALTGPLSLKRTKVAALGSDDLRHWRLLGSGCGTAVTAMRGTGARYIAIVACSELKPGQTISGCTFFY